MGISPSEYGSYASPVKGMPPLQSTNYTPLKRVNGFSPLKDFGESDSDGRSVSIASSSTFKPLETPSTWAFKWTTPRSLSYLEGLLKANCRFTARYDRVGENVLMHLPFCVRADTLKRKLADHLPNISFSHVATDGLNETDVLDIIINNTSMLGVTSNL